MERKDLSDLVHSFTAERPVFASRLRLMSAYPHRLLVITAALSTVKSSYPFSDVNPNRIMQSLIAALAGWNVPFVCTERTGAGDLPICTRFISTTGSTRLAMVDIWPTMICSGK